MSENTLREFTVSSIPLKDVVQDLAKEMNTSFREKCSEYYLDIPNEIGSGQIRGINFKNGLGVLIYKCKFNMDTKISFTKDDVHPLKYLYAENGSVKHQFPNEESIHPLKHRMCAIVASKNHFGHILQFEKNTQTNLVSLEINRERLAKDAKCELENVSSELKNVIADSTAEKTFYHEGYYSLEFQSILESIDEYKNELLIRRFHLESRALDIFVEQVQLFEDDVNGNLKDQLLRYNELERIKDLSMYISANLDADLSIDFLSRHSGLNPSKLQKGFKYIFDKTVRDFIISKRIEKSQNLLLSSDDSIATISSRMGFDSPSYFTKIFKAHLGLTPSEFRSINKR
jgi:AraC-like DNA-binding protein